MTPRSPGFEANMEAAEKFLGGTPERNPVAAMLLSDAWTPEEKAVVLWQLGMIGDFRKALWQAIVRADENNLALLMKGFPVEVRGFIMWHQEGLGERLRAAGIEI